MDCGLCGLLVAFVFALTTGAQTTIPIAVRVDVSREVGAVPPVWAFFGYDEPNYTYMPLKNRRSRRQAQPGSVNRGRSATVPT